MTAIDQSTAPVRKRRSYGADKANMVRWGYAPAGKWDWPSEMPRLRANVRKAVKVEVEAMLAEAAQ